MASSPLRKKEMRPKSSDSSQSRSRWPLTFSRGTSNGNMASDNFNSGASNIGNNTTNTMARSDNIMDSKIYSRSSTANYALSRGLKGSRSGRPGSASTMDSYATALPSPTQMSSDLPSPRCSVSSAHREKRLDNVLADLHALYHFEGKYDKALVEKNDRYASKSSIIASNHQQLNSPFRKGARRQHKSPERLKETTLPMPPLRNRGAAKRSVSAEIEPVPVHPLSKSERVEWDKEGRSITRNSLITPRSFSSTSAPTRQSIKCATPPTHSISSNSRSPNHGNAALAGLSELYSSNTGSNSSIKKAWKRNTSATLQDTDVSQFRSASTPSSDPIASSTSEVDIAEKRDKSGNAIRDKLKKKTGNLIKKMGGNTSSVNSKSMKRASHSSLVSEGGASIAYSTKSAPGKYGPKWSDGIVEPIPDMPDKFKEGFTPRRGSLEDEVVPPSTSIQSRSSAGTKRGQHMPPSSAEGSTGSVLTEMRHTLRAWTREMDSALGKSGQDLDKKTEFNLAKSSANWTPSPQLPECNLSNRPRSFMDEEGVEEGAEQSELLKSADTMISRHFPVQDNNNDQRYLSPLMQQAQRPSNLGLEPTESSLEISNSSLASSLDIRVLSNQDTIGRLRKPRNRKDGATQTSTDSHEIAIDRPSNFLYRGVSEGDTQREFVDELKHVKDKTITQINKQKEMLFDSSASDSVSISTSDQKEDFLAQEMASRCWNEDDTHRSKDKIAEWLGRNGSIHQASRRYYMMNFDFANLRIDIAFRRLCDKLYLRAETQQVDRILSAFGQRYFDCNPKSRSLLLNADVVHALVFSILLLNTDLHVAEMQDRMTKVQFVRNTLAALVESNEMTTVTNVLHEEKERTEEIASRDSFNLSRDEVNSASKEFISPSLITTALSQSQRRDSNDAMSLLSGDGSRGECRGASTASLGRSWEIEMETLLKEIYQSVKNDQIRLPIGANNGTPSNSKTMRIGSDRVNALKRGSIRGLQGLLGSSYNNHQSNSSIRMIDDSPTISRVSLNSTHKSQSDSFTGLSTPSTSLISASSYGLPPTLGFANTLSQSIIKEANNEDDGASLNSAHDDPTDDELALMGPPWAKEGNLTRKLYWEAPQCRAKDKNWINCFAVVQKGTFSMFKFGESGSNSFNATNGQGGAVGGGNWLSNAICIGEISLAHTVANALPPPGYNRARPHVFALTLPSGHVYFFQTGHEDLLQEWVSTCNYWAARQSKEPLAGGVSNMEYGWSRVMPNDQSVSGEDQDGVDNASNKSHLEASRPSFTMNSDTRSIRSGKSSKSLRLRAAASANLFRPSTVMGGGGSAEDRTSGAFGSPTSFSFSSDRPLYINEWREPSPPTISSTLNEEDQLEACKKYKQRVEMELTQHNALRNPMMKYLEDSNGSTHQGRGGGGSSDRVNSANMNKAIGNFDRKASYLLSDLTKFTLYTATLISANRLKAEKRDARLINRMMLKADEESSKIKEEEEGPPIKM